MSPLLFSQRISHPLREPVCSASLFITGAYRKSLLVARCGLADVKANAVSRQLI